LFNTDAGELEDASSTTSQKQKEMEPARARKQATKKGKFINKTHIIVHVLSSFFLSREVLFQPRQTGSCCETVQMQ